MQVNNYNNIEDFENPADKQKSRIAAGLFLVFVLFLLIYPWFKTTFPVPEAEGLMASFGDVEIAGGSEDFVKPVEEPTEEPVEETVEEPIEEPVEETVDERIETVNNTDAPVVDNVEEPQNKPTPTPPQPKPQVNQKALFPGSSTTNGKGTGSGAGTQGTPDGKEDLGGTGAGEEGRGKGKIGSRRNTSKCEDYKSGNADWKEKGKAVVYICVNARGKVISAKINRRKSTITNSSLIELVEGCAKEYTYERAPGQPDACGEITIQLGFGR